MYLFEFRSWELHPYLSFIAKRATLTPNRIFIAQCLVLRRLKTRDMLPTLRGFQQLVGFSYYLPSGAGWIRTNITAPCVLPCGFLTSSA